MNKAITPRNVIVSNFLDLSLDFAGVKQKPKSKSLHSRVYANVRKLLRNFHPLRRVVTEK